MGLETSAFPQRPIKWAHSRHDIPDMHAVRNVGNARFRNRLVEFK
ncbi:MAG: hypothetical protein ACE5KW_00915 [Dehalococcoidia bacterium]